MAKTDVIRARIEPDLKRNVEAIFHDLGLTTTQAITLFYQQILIHKGIPFEIKLCALEDTSEKALYNVLHQRPMKPYDSIEELIKKFT